ncbi:MAG: phospholipase [Propionibacteriales bacterium]|nr:phospholipase [Propionibacteriales bacterium]
MDDAKQAYFSDLHDSLQRLREAYATHDDTSLNAAVVAAAKQLSIGPQACGSAGPASEKQLPAGAHKIKHVVIVMQENRSFDHYFGTFPGAAGIPMEDGVPAVCLPNPATGGCSRPEHHSTADYDHGGPHTYESSLADINGGKMDGFISQWQTTRGYCLEPAHADAPTCVSEALHPDVMGYHDDREIPNYWEYADRFVLQDHMFSPNLGWSQPAHLALVSGWSAHCKSPYLSISCQESITFNDIDDKWPNAPSYAWTDLTYLLHKYGVSWRYYVAPGSVKDCEGTNDEQIHCDPGAKDFDPIGTPEIWNPLPDFTTVRRNHQVDNVQYNPKFFKAAREGSLPSLSWVLPGWYDSDHPPSTVSRGQAWVTRVVNAIMRSPDWKSSAIFVAWDDWGGFYDHVVPPKVDKYSYGLRVPAFMLSPYAKTGMIDHQVLSFDAYLKFVEDLFLHGERLNPFTDGRWDPRPRVAEEAPELGNLMKEFDFKQQPRSPLILPLYPGG